MKKYYLIVFIIFILIFIIFINKLTTIRVILVSEGNIVETIKINKNAKVGKYSTPEKEGYVFIGYYDKDNNRLSADTILNEDTTYYALYAEIAKE